MKKHTINIRNILLVSLMVLALGVSAMAVTPGAPAAQAAAAAPAAPASPAGAAATPTPGSTVATVTGGFTVTGDAAGYTYDQTNGVLTVKDGAVLRIANAASAATTHKIVVEKDASVDLILAGVNIDVTSGNENCAFEIAKDSAGSVTVMLADGTTNILRSGLHRAGLEKEGTNGSLTIRCAHSGETGHVCDTTTCGALEAGSANCVGAGIGSGSDAPSGDVSNIVISGGNVTAIGGTGAGIGSGSGFESGAVSNITICGGNVRSRVLSGAGIGSGMGEYSSGDVSNIVVFGGNVTVDGSSGAGIGSGFATYSAVSSNSGDVSNITISGGSVSINISDSSPAIGSGYADDSAGDVTNIIISGGSVKASGGVTDIGKGGTVGTPEIPVTPTDAKGNNVYLCKMAIIDPATSVTVNGISYGKHTYYHPSGWTTENYAYIYLPNGFYPYGESGLLMAKNGTVTLDPTPTATVTDGFTVTGDAAGYTYDQTNGVLTVKDGAVLMIKNTGTAATTHKIVVEKDTSVDLTLAGVNIDVSSGNENCAFEIAKDSAGSVTVMLADGTTNILRSGLHRAGLEKAGTAGSLTIRCAHSGESGHVCDTTSCGALEASSKYGSGIGSERAHGNSAPVSNITISGGNVTASSDDGAGIGSGYGGNCSDAVSNITISGGNVTASSRRGAGIGSGYCAVISGAVSNITISGGNVTASSGYGAGIGGGIGSERGSGDVSNIVISGGSVKASSTDGVGIGQYCWDGGPITSTPVTPTDGKGNNVYLFEIVNADGKPVTINGKSYPAKHRYHDGSAWTTEGKLYPYLPGDGSGQIIKVGDTTSVKLYSGTGFVDASVLLLSGDGTVKGGYANLPDAINAAANGDTVKLAANVSPTAIVEIGKKLTLDLNGKTVSATFPGTLLFITTAGDLTVRDSATGGKISSGGCLAEVAGKFTLESGTLESESEFAILAEGNATLKGGTVKCRLWNDGTIYADGGEVTGGSIDSENYGTITRHADATGTTKFYGKFTLDVSPHAPHMAGTIEAGEFYGDVKNDSGVITGGTFHGTVRNCYNETGYAYGGSIKPASPGSIVINGALIFEDGKNCTDYNPATLAWTFADVTKEYLTNTLKLGGTGYVQVGDIRYVYGASGLFAAAASDCTIVLINDVSISSTFTIDGTITLDLNGYTLKYESGTKGSVIRVSNGANFTLKDSSTAQSGKITGGWGYYGGGGVCNMGTFTMEGGKITGCSVASGYIGGGVSNEGDFTMKGGSISGCTADYGDGVLNMADFAMEGGVIFGEVYNLGVLRNNSTTDATIVYGKVENRNIFDGNLVKFMEGENIYAYEVVASGNKGAKPIDLEKTGYKFVGWYNGDVKFEFGTDTVTADLVLTAKWEQPDYVGTLQDAQNDLKDRIEALNSALAEKANEETINAAIVALQGSVSNLTSLLDTKAAQADLDTLSQTVSDLSAALNALDAVKDNYVDADTTLKAELQDIIDDANEAQDLVIEQLKNRLTTAETNISNLTNNKADAAEVAEALGDLNDIIDAVKQAYQDADDDLKAELQDVIDGAVETINTTIDGLKDRLTEAENDIIDLVNNKADAAEVAEALGDLNDLIEAVKQAYQDADDDLKEELLDYINRANDTQDGTIIALRYRLTEAEKNLAALTESKADAAEVAEAVGELNELIEAVKQAYKDADDDLKEELQASIDSAVETLNETIDDIKQRLSSVETSVAELLESKADALDVSNALNELRESVAALEAVKEAYKGADEELKQALQASIDGAVETLNETIDGLKDRVSAAEQDIASLIENKADASEVQKALDELSAAIDALEAVKDNYASADEALKSELTQKITDAQSALQESIGKVSADLTAAQEALNKAIADGDKDLADKIASLNEQLELAKSALNKADADSKAAIEAQISAAQSALSEAVDALSEELAALKTELTEKDDQLQTFTTVVCVIASVSFVGIAVFVIWFFLDRKKHI